MKLITQLNPKHLFRSKKSRSVSRSDPSFSSGSSSSLEGISTTSLKAGSTTPTSVLPAKSHEISTDGYRITRRELETLLIRVGVEPPSDEELTMMLNDVDDQEGVINLEKIGEISSSIGGPACSTEIRDTFDFFDADRDGKISAEELLGVFIAIGDEGCTLDDCMRMIAGVDSDGDGFVCFEDFARMMEHQRR